MSNKSIFGAYMKFFLAHFDDYLDVLLGLEEKTYSKELIEYKLKLKRDKNQDYDSLAFMKYLELEEIEFKAEDYVR